MASRVSSGGKRYGFCRTAAVRRRVQTSSSVFFFLPPLASFWLDFVTAVTDVVVCHTMLFDVSYVFRDASRRIFALIN